MYPKRDDSGIDAEERSELLESLLEAIGVPFVVVGSNLRVLFFSRHAASLFGLSAGPSSSAQNWNCRLPGE